MINASGVRCTRFHLTPTCNIASQVENKIMKEQRRLLLMEQLKSIKKELGLEKDDKSALLQRCVLGGRHGLLGPGVNCRLVIILHDD